MATIAPALPEIEYPSSDGEPVAETPIHRQVMFELISMLDAFYEAESDVYVSGNMMMYYVEGNSDKSISPDVFVTLGIPKLPEREIYQIWREGKGPDVVFELTSSSTMRFDLRRKMDLYRDVLRVREYILFDPRERSLAGTNLCGYRLAGGQYELIAKIGGRVTSEVLGLELEPSGQHLRLYDPRRAIYLPTPEEIRKALERESVARQAAEARAERDREARERESAARQAAEARAERDREARERESAARQAAEAERDRLRREIEALRRTAPPSP
jgi:Uma2 family endonuclease